MLLRCAGTLKNGLNRLVTTDLTTRHVQYSYKLLRNDLVHSTMYRILIDHVLTIRSKNLIPIAWLSWKHKVQS